MLRDPLPNGGKSLIRSPVEKSSSSDELLSGDYGV
jgi:hypothetical protein